MALPEILDFYRRNKTLGMSEREREATIAELYYLGRQYDSLAEWSDVSKPLRKRKPLVQLPLYKEAIDAISRFIWGGHQFPEAFIAATRSDEDGEVKDDIGPILNNEEAECLTKFLRDVVRIGKLPRALKELTRKVLTTTSGAVIVGIRNGYLYARVEDGKNCTPTWADDKPGTLEQIEIKYKFPKEEESASGVFQTREYWYRRVITRERDIVYKEVPVVAGQEPQWQEDAEKSVEHSLGICPVRWFRTKPDSTDDVDGTPVIDPQLYAMIDEINYAVSLRARSIKYVTDPQIVRVGVPDGEREQLNKNPGMPWDIPLGGEVKFLELSGSGAEAATAHTDDLIQHFQNAVAYVKADPKTTSGDISGVVLEFLHAPMIALAADLRDDLGSDGYCGMLALILQIVAIVDARGEDVWIPGVKEACRILNDSQKLGVWLDPKIDLAWQPFFSETAADKAAKVTYTNQATQGDLISLKTGTKHVASIFGIADPDVEHEVVDDERDEAMNRENASLMLRPKKSPEDAKKDGYEIDGTPKPPKLPDDV